MIDVRMSSPVTSLTYPVAKTRKPLFYLGFWKKKKRIDIIAPLYFNPLFSGLPSMGHYLSSDG